MTHPSQPESPEVAPRPEREGNFNDYVLVKVTPAGEKIWDEHWAEVRVIMGNPEAGILERDEDGFTKIQLWELANVFGPAMCNGSRALPVEMNFKFPESDM